MQNEFERADPQTTPAGAAAGDGHETADRDAVRHSADGESLMTVEVSAAPETTSDPAAAPELPPRGGETIIEIESTANRAEPASAPASAVTPAATSPAMPAPASAVTPEPPGTAPLSGTPTARTTEVDRPDLPEPAAKPIMTTGVETTTPNGAPEPGADPDAASAVVEATSDGIPPATEPKAEMDASNRTGTERPGSGNAEDGRLLNLLPAPPLIEVERLRARIDSANRELADLTEGSDEVPATETHEADEAARLTETPEGTAPAELLDANLTSRISQSLHGSADWSPWDGLTGDLAPAETAEVITRGILRAAAGLIDAARPDGLKKTDGLGEAAAFTIAAMHVEQTFGISIGEIVAAGGTAAARAFNVLRRTARELEAGTRRLKRERRRRPDKAPPPNPGALTHDRDADASAGAAPPHESYDASEQDAPSVETPDPADPTPAADDPSNLEKTEVSSERRQPAPARINRRADDPDELEKETAPPHESYDADEREAPSPGAAARSPIWLPRPVLGTRGGDRVPNSASWACSRDPSFAPGRRPGPRFGSLACSRIFDQRLHDPCGGRKKPAVQNGDPPKRPRADHLLEKNSAAAREAGRPGHRQRNEIGRRLDADADATAPLDDVENDRAIAGPEVDEHIIGTDRS